MDGYLASAFGIKTEKTMINGKEKMRLKAIDDKKYVLTLDFALKVRISLRLLMVVIFIECIIFPS